MNTELERRKQEITRSQGRRKLWQRIVSALAAIVMFVTTYVLILPVEAQNRTFCDAEAHEHSAENGCYVETKTLKCEEKHEHTDECYITLLTLICQHEEHTHNKECYADKTADIETQADWEASIKAAKLTGEWSKDIIAIASTQLGYRESERNYILGENNEIKGYTRYGDWIGDKYVDWSAAFVAFCVNYTGISKDEMTYDRAPEQWMELVKNDEQFNENIAELNPGDIVFIDENGDNKADRVGIVTELITEEKGADSFKIKTVEGDINNAVSYAEYLLSGDASAAARTDQTNVDSSVEESNSKDFAEAKSTTGRAARAEEKPNIIGSVSLPKNPNYNPPIAITDPENTTSPDDRIKETSSPENRVTPTTPPSSRDNRAPRTYTAPPVPTLTNLDPTTKVVVLFNGNIDEFITLADALDGIEQAAAMGASEFTVVFTANYTMNAADHTAMFTNKKGASASKIYFTSCYNNGTSDITSSFAAGNYFIANTETDIYNLTFSGGNQIQGGGNKLTIGTGVVGNTSSDIWGGLLNANLESDTDVSVFSGTWNYIGGGSHRTTGSYTITGDSICYIGGTTVTSYASGGSHTSDQTGNTSLTIGGSAKVTQEAFGGAWGAAITGNTTLVITDDAEVNIAYGGSYNAVITGDETSLTINGRAKVTGYAFASSYGSANNKLMVNISDQANVNVLYSANQRNVLSGAQIIYNIDGTDGAYVKNIYPYPYYSGTVAAGVDIDITIKNMKDIANIDGITNTNGSGTITIIGDVQVQRCTYANVNTDLVLEENATLQCGSNSDLSVVGTGDTYCGYLSVQKSLTMKQGSKLIMAGDSNSNAYRVIKNIDVQGADCEIDILKRETATYPIQVSGEELGSDKLKLGIFIHPLDTTTQIQGYGEVLLIYASEPNAIVQDYELGQNVENLCKNVANIVTCKDISDGRIDISKGRFVAGTNYDMSDPDNPVLNATQYVDNTGTIYAQDHALKPSYTIYGSNTVAYAPVSQSSTNDPRVTKIMKEGVLTPVGANEKILVTPNTTVELKFDGVVNLRNVTDYACIRVSRSYATLTLLDNAELNVNSVNSAAACGGGLLHSNTDLIGAAAIMKNGDYGDLIIQCEHSADLSHRCSESTCGKLTVTRTGPGYHSYTNNGAFHNIGIGAARNSAGDSYSGYFVYNQEQLDPATVGRSQTNFCNLYIKGGNISVAEAEHIAAIGSFCSPGAASAKNINISGGRVYAKGGQYSAAIGGGAASPLDGLYISNGAYVYAVGGIDAPAIGAQDSTTLCSNVVISGGDTVVIAEGGRLSSGNGFSPGLGSLNMSDNVYASPDTGYNAIIRQGQSRNIAEATFIDGVPSPVDIDIPCGSAVNERQYFTIVYFQKIEKTAKVNGGAEETGTDAAPIPVNAGDRITYKLTVGKVVDNNEVVTGYVVDELPAGLTFAGSPSPAAGFSYSYDDSSKRYTVRWDNQTFTGSADLEFSVDVTVDALAGGATELEYRNQAQVIFPDPNPADPANPRDLTLTSNLTYHKQVRQAPPEVDLTVKKTVQGATTTALFGFEIDIPGASALSAKLFDANDVEITTRTATITGTMVEVELGAGEYVVVSGVPVGASATITEPNHPGYTVLIKDTTAGGVTLANGNSTTVTVSADLELEVINNAGFELPHTGGTGSLILTLGGVILVATALMYGISLKRRQWRAWI